MLIAWWKNNLNQKKTPSLLNNRLNSFYDFFILFIVNKAYSFREQINDGVIYSQSKKGMQIDHVEVKS